MLRVIFCWFFVAVVFATNAIAQETGERTSFATEKLVMVGGATGRTGNIIVQHLVERGYRVRGMTRDRERAIETFDSDVEWVEADVRDFQSLSAVFVDVDYFISAVGTESRSGDNGPEQVSYQGTKNLVDAAKANGVEYYGLISSGGVTNADEYIALGLNDGQTWRFKGEQYLRASGLSYTVVRAAGMRDFPGGENGILLLQKDEISPGLITRSDVAAVMVECLANPDAIGKTFAITNYLALDPEAWRDGLIELDAD